MKIAKLLTLLLTGWLPLTALADIDPKATYTDSNGDEVTKWEDFVGDAPLRVRFEANASSLDAGASLEWHFNHTGANGNTQLTRYEENPEFVFTESGQTVVSLLVRQDDQTVDSASIRITISESHLEMPNAFSPNGDGHNDIYGAKGMGDPNSQGRYKSIVSFHAYIFNRWGQKLFEWTDITKGWDGTFNGHPVKDGVYFVLVEAKGADGRDYKIRRDVNLIRKYNETMNSSSNE